MTDIQETRAWLVEEMRAHKAADRLVQGLYWDNGKGCAVGCAMQSLDPDAAPNDHARYAKMIGAPEMLVRLEDCIFEGLPGALAREWPVRFTIALRDSGADEEALRRACMRFLQTTVSRSLERYADAETRAACQPALNIVAASAKGQPISADEERDVTRAALAARAARAAAWVTDAAERAARRAALGWMAAERAVEAVEAVEALEGAVALVEWAAARAARAADEDAGAAVAAALAMRAALAAAYTEMADTLIAEIEAAS